MKNVIVTGATSMIGVALINELVKDFKIQNIYAVVRSGCDKIDRLPLDERIKIIYCDISEYSNLSNYIQNKCDTFYHLAWTRTLTYNESYNDIILNCKNIQNVLEAMCVAKKIGCNKFIGTGTQAEYGVECIDSFSPESVCKPVRADGIAHLAAGQLAKCYADKIEMDCIWMRVFSIYGEYDRKNSMISSTIIKLLNKEHCSFTKSEQKWDYLYANDAGKAFYLVGKKVQGSHIYCLGSGVAKPLKEYIEKIRDIVSPNAELGFGELKYPENPVMNLCANIKQLQCDTGWKPEVEFEVGIKKICKYLQIESEN